MTSPMWKYHNFICPCLLSLSSSLVSISSGSSISIDSIDTGISCNSWDSSISGDSWDSSISSDSWSSSISNNNNNNNIIRLQQQQQQKPDHTSPCRPVFNAHTPVTGVAVAAEASRSSQSTPARGHLKPLIHPPTRYNALTPHPTYPGPTASRP